MMSLESLCAFSHDNPLWRLRVWLLERAILVMTGDMRWALLQLGCRMMSSSLAQARLWISAFGRARGC